MSEEDRQKLRFEGFTGTYTKAIDCLPIIPAFRDEFMEGRYDAHGKKVSVKKLVDRFNGRRPDEKPFFPGSSFIRRYVKKWDEEIIKRKKAEAAVANVKAEVARQLLADPSQNPNVTVVVTTDGLEDKAGNLGDALLDDAKKTLEESYDDDPETVDPELRLKKKNYALHVYNFVTKNVHKRREIDIRLKEEQRAGASFMLDLINRAITGKLSKEQMNTLANSMRTLPAVDPANADPLVDTSEIDEGLEEEEEIEPAADVPAV